MRFNELMNVAFVCVFAASCGNEECRQKHVYDIISASGESRANKVGMLNGINRDYISEVKRKLKNGTYGMTNTITITSARN